MISEWSTKKKRFITWSIVFLFYTFLAFMNFTRFVTSELAVGRPGKIQFYFIMETTGAYTSFLLVPIAVWFIRKVPVKRNNLRTRIPIHLFATMVFGASHTMMMYVSRLLIFWLANLGTYDYGRILIRFPMEYTHQFFTYWIIFGIVLFFKFVRERQEEKINASRLMEQLTKARLQALQMQIHPHFLFNTLNMISSTMYDDIKAADKMMANLSDLLRITLNSASSREHTLEKEMEIIRFYIEIMRARFQDKLTVRLNMGNDTLKALVPAFLLQPLVENSIKFSMESLKQADVEISSKKENDRLLIMIQDNGPGMAGDRDQVMKKGVGLSNTVERLEGLYGADHTFLLENLTNGGLQVTIDIPFRNSFQKDNADEGRSHTNR